MSDVRIEICEAHGLRYNAAATDGCARCLREAESGPEETASASAPGPTALGPQAGITAALILTTGFLFWGVHRQVVGSIEQLLESGPAPQSVFEQARTNDRTDHDVRDFLQFIESPIVQFSRDEDPQLDAMISELEDPERRNEMTSDELQEKIDAVYERLWGGEGY